VTSPIRGASWIHRTNKREQFAPGDFAELAAITRGVPVFRSQLLRLGSGFFAQAVADRDGQTLDSILVASTGDDSSMLCVAGPWTTRLSHWDLTGTPTWTTDDNASDVWQELASTAAPYATADCDAIWRETIEVTSDQVTPGSFDAAVVVVDCTVGVPMATDWLRTAASAVTPASGSLFVVLRQVQSSEGQLDGVSVAAMLGSWGVPQVRVRQLNTSERFGARNSEPAERIVVVSARM
jgi:hypothetical protein